MKTRVRQVPAFEPKKGVKIHTNDAEAQNAQNSNYESENVDDLIAKIRKSIGESTIKLNPIDFEKVFFLTHLCFCLQFLLLLNLECS